jgi:hypothetical protein
MPLPTTARRSLAAVLVATAALLALSGCEKIKEKLAEKAAEKAMESATGGKIDLNSSSGGITIKDEKNGAVVQAGAGATVPKDWPSAIPVYPGATVQAAMATPQGKTLHLVTTDGPDKVVAFYTSKLPGKQTALVDLGQSKTIAHENGKDKIAVVANALGDGKTQIMLSISQ